jgi:hypothetical protein
MRFLRLSCLALLMAASPSAAQDAPAAAPDIPASDWPVAVGSRVRIRSALLNDVRNQYTPLGFRYATGTVVSATPDTLTFRADGDSAAATAIIPTRRILNLEIARGTHDNMAKGALMGSLAGLIGGEAFAAITHNSCQEGNCDGFYGPGVLLTGRLIGLLGGAAIGAWMGRRPSDTWVPVAVPRR